MSERGVRVIMAMKISNIEQEIIILKAVKEAQSTFPVMKLEAGYILPKVFNHWREVPCGALQ
jgi:hypothetical protein